MKKFYFALFFLTAITFAFSQSVGDFRSAGNGNWTNSASWQIWNGTSWIAAPSYPGQLAPPPTPNITIQSGNTITIASNLNTQPLASVTVLGNLILSPPNPANLITLNTPTLNISGGNINFSLVKTRLDLPAGAVITIDNSGSITASTCNNNNEIFIGARKYAACAGAAGGVYTFGEVTTAGGNVNASISNPATGPVSASGCALINIAGGFSGTASGTVTYTWFIRNPNNIISTIGTGTFSANPGTTSPASFTPTISGEYLLSLEVRTGIAPNIFVNVETRIINVSDNTPPTITCPGNQTGNVDASCDFSIPDYTSLATTGDNCGVASVTQSPTAGTVVGVGTTNIVLTVNDVNGNSVNCNFDVVVTDNVTPTITCAADVAVNVDAGQCYATISLVNPATSDACGINAATLSNDAPATFPVGTTTVTWTVDDNNGNTSTCAQDVVVTDNENPTLTCPADLTVQCDASTLPANTGTATASDNCAAVGNITITYSDVVSAVSGNNSTITRTWTATDDNSNSSSCDQIITVVDTTPPTITCPADLTVQCDASTLPANTGTATASDNCAAVGNITITYSDVVSAVSGNNSTITRTWTATDDNSNSSSCDQIITVVDTTPPTITCPADLTVQCDASTLPANTGTATASDNCAAVGNITITYSDVVSAVSGNNSTITRTWTATDDNSNSSSCDQIITVVDTTPPTITCPADLTVQCDASTLPANTGTATASDNCAAVGNITITYSDVVSAVSGNNSTITRTWTATDDNSNSSSCDQIITVVDTTPPTITCPADLTVQCDASTLPANTGTATASDNCAAVGNITITYSDVVSAVSGNNSTITRTWTATDDNSNSSSCDQIITVVDTTPPTITCPADLTVQCDASTLPANTGTATASDNCAAVGNITITYSDVVSAVSGNNSTITRTWTATDDNSNSSSCDQIITVVDTTPPTITCPADLTVQCDASTLPANTGTATASDNCAAVGNITITYSDVVSAVSGNNSTITRTWTATDDNSNSSSCDQIITVVDTTPPTITCPADLTVQCDASTLPANTGTATASDNCAAVGNITITYSDVVSAVSGNNSTITRTWTATDDNSNSSSCDQIITVVDTTPPTITCPADLTVQCDASTLPANTGTATASDNCAAVGNITITYSDVVSAVSGNNSTITRTWTATDDNSNSSSCDQIITVVDTTPPTITCPADLTVQCDASTLPANTGTATASDNCAAVGNITITYSDVVSAVSGNNSTITRTWTATDDNSNSSSCDQIITVVDTTPPTITCPADLTVQCDASTLPANTGTATASDNCAAVGNITITYSDVVSAVSGNNSTITRTWTATDDNSNSSSCDQIITVVDTTPPTITCPADLTVQCDASTLPANTGTATASDNCAAVGNITITYSDVVSAVSGNNSTITRTWTATDDNSNSSSCDQIITVVDTTPPTITCPADLTVQCDASTLPANTGTATASDNCAAVGNITITYSDVVSAVSGNNSTITRTWTATDDNSNSSSCDQIITVVDTTPPTITCPADLTVQCDASTLPANTGTATASDNCAAVGNITITYSDVVSAVSGNNSTITRTWTATDDNSNSSSCDQIITVVDTTPPTITCPADVTASTSDDGTGNCTTTVNLGTPTASDNCTNSGTISFTARIGGTIINPSTYAFPVGTTTVVWTATDVNGNTSNGCNQTVTISDNEDPILTPGSNQNVNLNASCQIIIPNVRGTATDNCTNPVTITQDPAQGSAVSATHNNPVNVTVTATDATGNTHILTVILTPRDVTLPTISCPSSITVTNDNGVCGANVTYATPTFNDNCSGASISQTAGLASGSIFPIGTTTNTFVVTDLAGNTRSCSFTVTVTDNQPPVLTPAPNQNVNLNASCQILVPDVRGTATDNCTNPVTITQSPAPNLPVAATHNSPITVTVTATDASGNTDVETVIVTPVDVTSPTISCPGNQSVNFDAGCEYVLTDYTSLGSASDNCDTSISITQSPAAGTILSGATTVTLTATDNAGLTGTCTFQVIPNDITPPNAICNDITVSLGVTGSVNILPTDVDNGSNDACGPVFFSISDSNFTCADIGPNTVTLTVSDNSGNSSSCTATVTVIDDTAPTMQCNDFVVVIDPLTQVATINPSEIDNGSNDACGLSSLTVSPNTFDTSQLGNNTVTLTATDNSGNINTCTAIVTVEPPINEDTILTGTIVDPLEPGENPLPPSALIEATACPGGITAPRDISLNLQASDPNTYNLQASQVIEWQYSQDNGETWNVLPSSAGTLSYTLIDITDDTFVRVRVYDANDPTLEQFSSQVFIRFLPPDEPPILTSDPRFDICLGESVLLTAESFFDQPNGQFGEGGEFNYAQPDGWRVNYVDGDFPAAGDNGREEDWKETNSNNNALFSNINYDTADNTKFALAHGVGNTTQLETPVFSTIGMTSAEAIMTFDTSFFFCNGGYGTIWLSFDSGVTYTSANELTAYWASDDTPINFTTGNNTGLHVTKQGNCNSANSQRASTEPRMTAAYLDLGPYVGLSGLRVRFEFFGSTSTCTNVSFPPAPGNDCDPVRTFDVASGWAIDNVGFAYAGVDDELEWTDEEGNVIAIGTQATVQPITPGIRNYGVTNLVNGCRAPGDDGTNDETLVYTSLAYAGQDYIPAGNQCGENFVQLHAYDNTIKARANYDLGNYEAGLYAVPVDDASDYDPTGVGGQWSIHNPTTTSCGNLATFSSNTDPNATFNASPGNYTLRWTLDDGSGCYDEINVTIVDCPTIDFDGIDDHIDFRNNYNFDSTYAGDGDFSVEVWVKPNSVNGTKTVFARKDDAVNTAGYALTVVDGQVRFNWYKAAGSGSITSGGLSIGTDRWYHLAVTFDGTEYLMYVDGILIATQGGSAPDATPNNIKALIGAIDLAPPNEATKYFHGWMDELRIWTRVLDVQHIRQMMNQEINASGANVMGAVIPTKIYGPDTNADGVEDNPLLWSELEGYYRMNVACGDFSPYKGVAGRLRNIQTSQQETAPLPYTSRASTSWDTDNTWTHHTVWDVPNSNGIDGTPIDWNIVRTTHNISTNSRNLTVLGLLVDQNKLTVTDLADANQDENNPGVGIWVTDYLKLNGEIDLVGESQLVQKRISSRQFNESILDVASAGNLERDQQGTTNLFNYNYFSSPVGAINTSANNVPENLINLLLDGTFTNTTPHPVINWTSSYNATGTTNPITLSNRWIFAYENFPFDNYASWNFKGNTGTLDPGYGFTMKGSGVGVGPEGDIITGGNQLNGIQNYVFKGKPNNEDIIVPITSWYQALVGNPYPSAIDSFEFIDDNVPGGNTGSTASIEGALYFWEHYTSNQTHILEEYEGGYAVLNKIGGVPVYEPALISGDGTPSKTPGQYVPVGQGFFVGSIFNYNGNIKFENDQRVFQREAPGNSVFIRGGVTKTNDKKSNTNNTTSRTIDAVDSQNSELVISRVRLNFKSVIDGKIRPLLLGFTSDNSATDGIDYGYEASNTYFQNNDAFFIIEDGVYVIQGVGEFNEDKIYPLGMFLSENSDVEVSLTDLENFENDIDVFIYDALLGTYTKLNDTNFEANLDPDYYFDRFFVTFKASSTLSDDDIVKDDLVYVAYLEASKDIYIKIPNKIAKEVNLINVLGQTVRTWDSGLEGFYSNAYRIPVSGLPSGTYILKVETDTSTISKKVIIK